jgi:hypothetical protein
MASPNSLVLYQNFVGPTNAPVTPSPTKAPVTPSPTIAPATPSPTQAPVTLSPTPSPTKAPVTPSPSTPSQLALSYFTEQGPGICVDGTGQYYSNYAIVRTDKAYSNTTVDAEICSDWCYQNHEDPFVGFSSGGISGGFLICECLFSGGSVPTGLSYAEFEKT